MKTDLSVSNLVNTLETSARIYYQEYVKPSEAAALARFAFLFPSRHHKAMMHAAAYEGMLLMITHVKTFAFADKIIKETKCSSSPASDARK
jgi:hypothetical protein